MKKALLLLTTFLLLALSGCGGSKLYISSDYIFGHRKEAKFGQSIVNVYYSTQRTTLVTNEPVHENMFLIQEFNYKGYNNSLLKITYKEYSVQNYSSYIKPDFSDTYEYEIQLPDTIHLNSIKVLVHKADNQRIEYTVLDDGGLVESLRTKIKSVKDLTK